MIGASIVTRNCLSQDYCLEASLNSLIDAVNEIVVVDCESTDGTKEWLDQFAKENAIVRVVSIPYRPYLCHFGQNWLCDVSNFARTFVRSEYHLRLQADECLHESEIWNLRNLEATRKKFKIPRVDFWRDHKHAFQGDMLCALAPTDVPYVADAGGLYVRDDIAPIDYERAKVPQIYHYGYIREFEKLLKKNRQFQGTIGCGFDTSFGGNPEEFWTKKCDFPFGEFTGTHPKYIHHWLKVHGYEL